MIWSFSKVQIMEKLMIRLLKSPDEYFRKKLTGRL